MQTSPTSMQSYDCLAFPLRSQVPNASRLVMAEFLWRAHWTPLNVRGRNHLENLCEVYFGPNGYFQRQCETFCPYTTGLESYTSAETHRHVVDIAELLQQPIPRAEVR